MDRLAELAKTIRTKNTTELEIAKIVGRPALIGHVGEFIASQIFDIELFESATTKGSDGYFKSGALAGKTVNVKWYPKREGLLDINPQEVPDYYIVFAGPKTESTSSRGASRPWSIQSVHLFEGAPLVARIESRGVKVGVATSLTGDLWDAAEIYPGDRGPIRLDDEQRRKLRLFTLQPPALSES